MSEDITCRDCGEGWDYMRINDDGLCPKCVDMERRLGEKAERVYELQREMDVLLSEILLEDELYGSQVTECLNEGWYNM